ncbi:sulfotransferase family 2 domain-containing protein [Mangrovimonas sp. DI 80]|uniref:sulfotransferase family 2 domain-containing protein n=1 Tax=Mangrovimonas sp. DI 80 TaxID=1779330 RepID=UPI0009761FC7|nr:sulfotransferase family 2 domain-containing protein [Mangrovimonas sp. DI 80]OMP31157.1 hypothetical protein BKM32_08835 [Mangrovimonas sp. DI 80]
MKLNDNSLMFRILLKLDISKKEKCFIDKRVNSNANVVFIHIPKTGGTSIIKSLGLISTTHIEAKEVFKNKQDGRVFRNKFSFAIVRDPIERFVSLYNYARMDVSYYHNNINPETSVHGAHLDYKLLREANLNECVKFLLEGKLRHDNGWNHWMPQYTWTHDEYGAICLVDKIYYLNNLELLKIDFKNKFNRELNIPVLNDSKSDSLIMDLSEESLEGLYQFYKKDYELFNFKKQGI